MRIIEVQHGQSIWDIALQEYGSVEAVFTLISDNPDVLTDLDVDLMPGQKLLIKGEPVNRDVVNFYTAEGVKPSGASTQGVDLQGDFNDDYNDDYNI